MLLRSALAALLIAVLTATASATAGLLKIDDILPEARPGDVIPRVGTDFPDVGRPQTVLLLGSDRRWRDEKDDGVRSDTLMLVRLDPQEGATTVLSLPRDLRVALPGRGTRRINDAYRYGGPALAVRTVRRLTGLKIHHVVNVNFRGFREAVNLFDCFYVDVDRRYFHSNRGVALGARYDAIDLQAGYQRLCGNDALDFARHRYSDSDIVRAARQQDLLRAAKDQVSTSRLIDDLERLGEVAGRAAQTDANLRTKAGFLRFAKLALALSDDPVRQVRLPVSFVKEDGAEYVDASEADLAVAVERFLHGGRRAGEPAPDAAPAAAAPRPRAAGARRPSRRRGTIRAAGLVDARAAGAELVRGARRRVRRAGLPVRIPSHLTPEGRFDELRVYRLRDRAGAEHRAYRVVVAQNRGEGQFYGVQGTTWRSPPLLAHPSAVRRVRGRRLELFRAGGRLRFVAWRTDRAAYWVANTLSMSLDDDEMLALAASLTPAS